MNELKVRKSEKSESPEVGEGRKTQKSGCLKDLSQPQPHSQPQSQPQPQLYILESLNNQFLLL